MPNRRPILIVEDDETLRNMLTEYLDETREFVVSTAADLEAADKILANEDAHFDAVILDIGLPDGDGRDYCARLRRQGHSMPIIMLTGAIEETDVVRGLDSGAGDYVAKPFRAASCWPACTRSCASSIAASRWCSRSGHTPSGRRRRCCMTQRRTGASA